MNRTPPPMHVREQAEAWYARLQAPDCSGREREMFERWRRQPAHARAYADTEALLAGVDALAAHDSRIEALMRRTRRRPLAPPRRPRWGLWAVAASAVIALALGLRFVPAPRNEPEPVPYAAATERRTLALEDGSTVELDVGSRIAARFGRGQRSIELLEGRALFDVAHDAARPFVVRAGDGSVTTLGTRFQVQRSGDSIAVTLAEGAVAVARDAGQGAPARQTRLQPGQRLSWSGPGGDWVLRAIDLEASLGWTRGRLIFRGTPLAEVVAEVNRYTRHKLVLDDASLATLPVHGNFVAGDAEGVAAALGAVLPLRVQETGEEIRLHRR